MVGGHQGLRVTGHEAHCVLCCGLAVACVKVVMVVDCCSITRDSDFTILGEPRRDLNTW